MRCGQPARRPAARADRPLRPADGDRENHRGRHRLLPHGRALGRGADEDRCRCPADRHGLDPLPHPGQCASDIGARPRSQRSSSASSSMPAPRWKSPRARSSSATGDTHTTRSWPMQDCSRRPNCAVARGTDIAPPRHLSKCHEGKLSRVSRLVVRKNAVVDVVSRLQCADCNTACLPSLVRISIVALGGKLHDM